MQNVNGFFACVLFRFLAFLFLDSKNSLTRERSHKKTHELDMSDV